MMFIRRKSFYLYNNNNNILSSLYSSSLSLLSLNISNYSFSTKTNYNQLILQNKFIQNINKNTTSTIKILDKMKELNITFQPLLLQKCRNKYIAKNLFQYFIANNIIPNDKLILKEIFILFVNCKMNKDAILLYKQYFENNSSIRLKDKIIELFVNMNDFNMIYKLFKQRIHEKSVNKYTLAIVLSYITNKIKFNTINKDFFFQKGKQIHQDIIDNEIMLSVSNYNKLILMYGLCKNIDKVFQIYNEMKKSKKIDIYSYNTIIKVLCENNKYQQAIEYYQLMKHSKFKPDTITYTTILSIPKVLNDIEFGKQLHKDIIDNNIPLSIQSQNQLIDMYGSCGDIDKALEIFNKMKESNHFDVYSWAIIIKVLNKNNEYNQALENYKSIIRQKIKANEAVYVSILSTVSSIKDIELGKQLHKDIIDNNIPLSIQLQNQLIDMYGSCGDIDKALEIFNKMKESNKLNIYSYNIIIQSFCNYYKYNKAIEYYQLLLDTNIQPDVITYTSLFPAITNTGNHKLGYSIYDDIKDKNYMTDNILKKKLIEFFKKCGDLEMSNKLYDSI